MPHCWILDPEAEVLAVDRWIAEGCLLVLTAGGQESIRAEPLEAVEFSVSSLLAGEEGEHGS
ncbi:hypothetical protein WMF38_50645 [Sorangium sp. So ce118]